MQLFECWQEKGRTATIQQGSQCDAFGSTEDVQHFGHERSNQCNADLIATIENSQLGQR